MSTYRQRIDRLARRHLGFSVANYALNPRFAAVTVGSCGDSWKLRRVAGEASNITENALSILIVIFSVQLQQTEISERKLFIFHLGHETLWNIMKHSPFNAMISACDVETLALDAKTSARGEIGDCRGDIGSRAEFPALAIEVLV